MIPIERFDGKYIHNPNPRGETPFEEFWSVREAIVKATSPFGKTGPEPDSSRTDPEYWLIDDQYNDELYHRLGVVYPSGWLAPWMSALIAVLQHSAGWAIHIDVDERSHIVLFADRVMVCGPEFEDCRDVAAVVTPAKEAATNEEERVYGPLMRQLEYLRTLLPDAIERIGSPGFVHLATFDSYEGRPWNSVWVLSSAGELSTTGKSRAVTDGTRIYERYCRRFTPYTEVSPPYWL